MSKVPPYHSDEPKDVTRSRIREDILKARKAHNLEQNAPIVIGAVGIGFCILAISTCTWAILSDKAEAKNRHGNLPPDTYLKILELKRQGKYGY